MSEDNLRVAVVPCSGIGKTAGSVARDAGYEVCDALRPDSTRLVALSKLVLGEEQARGWVRSCPVITIDGCKHLCAAKLVKLAGGTIAREVTVLDAHRKHRELKPDGIAELNEQGKQLALIMGQEIAELVDEIGRKPPEGGAHA